MKTAQLSLLNIISHPVIQALCFSWILVGSPYFGGPYIFFVCGSFTEGYVYGILGVIGIALTLLSLVKMRGYLQIAGLLCMLASLAVFFLSSKNGLNSHVTRELFPFITLLVFVIISIVVPIRFIQKQNDA